MVRIISVLVTQIFEQGNKRQQRKRKIILCQFTPNLGSVCVFLFPDYVISADDPRFIRRFLQLSSSGQFRIFFHLVLETGSDRVYTCQLLLPRRSSPTVMNWENAASS
jgi:hypothetical protein